MSRGFITGFLVGAVTALATTALIVALVGEFEDNDLTSQVSDVIQDDYYKPVSSSTLDHASVGIRGDNEPLQSCAQLLDLDAQLFELPLHVELLGLQVDRLLRVNDEFVRHWAAGVKWPSIPTGWEASLPRTCLRPR